MSSLVAIRGPSAGKRYRLSQSCVLGRSFNSDIYIGDLNVSRRHAQIVSEADGRCVVEDLGSGNGTFVNDRLVKRQLLSPCDVLRIGGSSFRYEPEQPEQSRWSAEVLTVIGDLVEAESGQLRLDPRTTAQLEQAVREHKDLVQAGDDRAAKMLKAVYAVADAIADELDLAKLLDKILDHIFDVFPQAERGFVLLVNKDSGQLVPEAVKQRFGSSNKGSSGSALAFSQTIVNQVLERGYGVIRGSTLPPASVSSPDSEQRRAVAGPGRPQPQPGKVEEGTQQGIGVGREVPKMGAPLICRGERLGTLHLEGVPGSKSFSREDLALLSAIARQAAMAIANARTGQFLVLQQRLEADLQMARRIQESFLPRNLPHVSGLEFESYYSAAQHVGGDFYDIVQLRPSLIGILVGDVSGKGVSAALLMARLNTAIRLHAQAHLDPASVLNHANQLLIETDQDAMFATVLYILLDLDAGTFTVANAGHQPPIVCSHRFSGVSELDDATAVALGVVPNMEYPQQVYRLIAGDVVLLYTDGINEAMNNHDQEYGMIRLRQVTVAGPAEPAAVVRRVVDDVQRFVRGAPQTDDQTLVAFGIRETTGPVRQMPLDD